MAKPIVFFSRCKPQEVDAIEIVRDDKRVFVGHPMARAGSAYDPLNLRSCVVDLACSEAEWATAHAASDRRRQFNQNRNLVGLVSLGSIALVPRPSHGLIYAGRVVSPFELVNTPTWYDRYMKIRGGLDGPDTWHAADVAQCWTVDQFRPIPVPRVPAWIRRSLFGRATYGVVPLDPIAGDPYDAMDRVLEGAAFEGRSWTLNEIEIGRRLLCDQSPSTFEHLVVALLQLEYPDEVWSHVGGSGDGGLDGIGASEDGAVVGLLQCKWSYWGGAVFPDGAVWQVGTSAVRRYLAALRYPDHAIPPDCEFLDRPRIVDLIRKHRGRLPQALSMRIGQAPREHDGGLAPGVPHE